jgi:filamentous hemagglutinin
VRAVEQALIKSHGLSKNGGTLINKINSISVNNPIYRNSINRGMELLQSIR